MKKFHFTTGFAAALLCGCMMSPDYDNPNETIGEREILDFQKFANENREWKTATPADESKRGDWWLAFEDPFLNALMQKCAADNPDVKSLYYRVEQALESACMTRAMLYPHVSGSGDWFKTEVGHSSLVRPLGSQFEDWALGATLTWDADLFGRIRSVLAASRAEAEGLERQYESALLALRAKVAAVYFSLGELEAERKLLSETVKIREAETKFVLDRVQMQTAQEADAERAKALEHSDKAKLAELEGGIALAKNLLANLVGTTPAKFDFSDAKFRAKIPQVPASIPSELLERRPDIAAAERAVFAANHRIGAAQAAFFPTVSITSSLGTETTAFSKLLNSSSFAWGVSPQVYIPIFQAGKLCAQKRAALAKHRETLEHYKSTVLKAVRETEDALAKIAASNAKAAELEAASRAAQKVECIAQAQYDEGAIDYFQAAQAHRAALSAKLAELKNRGDQFRATVELFHSINGFFNLP